MLKVFISQPMAGKTDLEILSERDRAIRIIKGEFEGQEIEIIDSFIEDTPDDAKPLWYLGKSFEFLSHADLAYFIQGWDKCRGCKMEHTACIEYGIDFLEE